MILVVFVSQVAYLDVCDDSSTAQRAKSYMNRALDANIPAITTGGIYPGVSNSSVALSRETLLVLSQIAIFTFISIAATLYGDEKVHFITFFIHLSSHILRVGICSGNIHQKYFLN